MKTSTEVRNLRQGEAKKHLEMLNLCFGNWGDNEKWKKMYTQPNFDATRNVIIVEENKEWAGGGTAWFRDAFLKYDKKTKVYVAGDLYVHPEHRGKGVYSIAMKSLNGIAQRKGASIGIAFPSISAIPSAALPKYGFNEVFRPLTWVYVLNPEKFLRYVFSEVDKMYVPEKYEGMKVKLQVVFTLPQREMTITKLFHMKSGRVHEISEEPKSGNDFDLSVKTDVKTLMKIYSSFYLKKRTLPFNVLLGLLARRIKARFSLSFLMAVLGINRSD